MSLSCSVCFKNYTSTDRKPRNLACGHTFCSRCISLLMEKPELTCPTCQRSWDNIVSIEDLSPNFALISLIESVEIMCEEHKNSACTFINKITLTPLCEECAFNLPKDNLLDIEEDEPTIWLINEIKSNQSKVITPNLLERIKRVGRNPQPSNSEKLKLLKEIHKELNKFFCDTHKEIEAIFFKLDEAKILCVECSEAKDEIIKLDDGGLYETIINKIIGTMRYSLIESIPVEYRKSSEELRRLTLRETIVYYKSFIKENIRSEPLLAFTACLKCKSKYSMENQPWSLPCLGFHHVCDKCYNSGPTVFCPIDGSENAKICLTRIFHDENPEPKCSLCRQYYDLVGNVPKELPCGMTVCLACIKNDFVVGKKKCKHCKEKHSSESFWENNMYFFGLLERYNMYCSFHRNKFAEYLCPDRLETLCGSCSDRPEEKIRLQNSKKHVSQLLCDTFLAKTQHLEFQDSCKIPLCEFLKLTNQEKIDKIREGMYPDRKDTLRSYMPKGKKLGEVDTFGKCSFIYRFWSVMPPEEYNENFIFVSKPWIIDTEKNQIESVVFTCSEDIVLLGLGLGQALNLHETTVDLIEIREGRGLTEKVIYIDNDPKKFNHLGEVQDIKLKAPFEVKSGKLYCFSVKIKGELVYRGNPFDLKEKQVGSDGTVFEFFEPEIIGDNYVNGQHDINGPIIKFVYRNDIKN